jgi:GT2 family glycosyltransferase
VSAATLDFSIIVPTYNRPAQLETCLSALSGLDYAADRYEVIVVDDGSSSPLDAVTAPFQNRLRLSLLRQANAGPAAARNRGAQAARATWLAFTDDDCQPAPSWLRTLAGKLAGHPDGVVGGHTVNGLDDNLCSTMSQIIVDVVYRHYNAHPEDARFFATNNLAIGRELFHRLGGFDASFITSEDRELCDRLTAHGVRMRYAADCVVKHQHALSLRGFCRQHFHYGRGAFRFHRSQVKRRSPATWSKTGFHLDLRNWLLYPFSQVAPRRWPETTALLFLWQFMNTAGFAAEALHDLAVRRGPRA